MADWFALPRQPPRPEGCGKNNDNRKCMGEVDPLSGTGHLARISDQSLPLAALGWPTTPKKAPPARQESDARQDNPGTWISNFGADSRDV